MGKQLSNKEKMIIKRKKYEEYLNQNQSTQILAIIVN